MAGLNLGDILVRMGLDAGQFTRGLRQASRNMTQLGQAARTVGIGLTAAITVPLVAGGKAAIKFAADFDDSMTKSLAIFEEFRQSTKNVNQELRAEMEKTASRLAVDLAIPAESVADAFFFLASAGLNARDSIAALPTVAQFAKAGMFDLATATSLATDVMKAMNLEVSDLARVTDVLVRANTLADATTLQFAESLTNKAAASLSFANKEIEEGVAVLALFAERGIKGKRAGDLLARSVRDLGDKAVRNEEAFVKFGISVFDSSGAMRNMADIADDLTKSFGTMSDQQRRSALIQLGFTIRAQESIFTLIGQGDAIRDFQNKLLDAGGIVQAVSENQMESFKQQMISVKEQVKEAARAFGDVFLPMIISVVDTAVIPMISFLKDMGEAFGRLPQFLQVGIIAFLAMLASIGPLLIIIGQLLITGGALVLLWPSIAIAATAAAGAFTFVSAAMATAAAAAAPFLLVMIQIAAAFSVGFAIGTAIRDFTGLGKVLDNLVDRLTGFDEAAKRAAAAPPPTSEADIRLMEEAEQLLRDQGEAFAVIPRTAAGLVQATDLMNTHNEALRAAALASKDFGKTAEENARGNLPALAEAFGATVPEMEAIADRLGITLSELEELATGSDKVALELGKMREAMMALVTTMGEVQEEVNRTSEGIRLSGGIAALSGEEQRRLGEEFLKASESGAVLGTTANTLVERFLNFQASALTTSGALQALQVEADKVSDLILRAGGAAELSSAALAENAAKFMELAAAGGVLDSTQQAVIDRFMQIQAVALTASANVNKLATSAKLLSAQIQLVGGATKLSGTALSAAAKQFKELEAAGGALTSSQMEVIALNMELEASQKAATDAVKEAEAAQTALTASMDSLKNAAGILTAEAGKQFENFAVSVAMVIDETGGVIEDGLEQAIVEAARKMAEQFPALVGELNAFLATIGVEAEVTGGKSTDAFDAMTQSIQAAGNALQAFGIDANSSLGIALVGVTNLAGQFEGLAADFKAGGFGVGGALARDPKTGKRDIAGAAAGVASGIGAIATATERGSTGARTAKGAIAGASAGAQVGGPIGAAVGAAVGAIVGFIRGRRMAKAMKEIQASVGSQVSEALAQGIRDAAKELDISVGEAALLNLADIFAEVGFDAEGALGNAQKAMSSLVMGIVDGTLPAAMATEELGQAFAVMASEVFKAGTVADAAMLQVVANVRAAGLEVPEVAAFIAEQLSQAASGIANIIGAAFETDGEMQFGGIQVASVEDAQAQATIFAAGFFATLEEQGLRAAVEVFGPAFGEMKAKLEEFGADVDFGGVARFFEIAADPKFGPLLDGVQGLNDAMTGLANAGFLTAETFSAFQQQAGSAFDQLIEAGLAAPEALQQLAPTLQAAIDASQRFGFTLDDNTLSLIEQAEAAGIGFATDPMQRMVEVLEIVALQLGATAESLGLVGVAAAGVGTAVEESLVGTQDRLSEIGERGLETMEQIREGIEFTGAAVADSLVSAGARGAEGIARAAEGLNVVTEAADITTEQTREAFDEMTSGIIMGMSELATGSMDSFASIQETSGGAIEATLQVGQAALSAASDFNEMASAASRAASAAGSARGPGGGEGGGRRGGEDREAFEHGALVTGPTNAMLGEAGPELVLPLSDAARTVELMGAVSAGRQAPMPMQMTIQIGSETFLAEIEDATRTNKIRIHNRSIQTFGD